MILKSWLRKWKAHKRSIAAAVVAQKIIRDTTLHGCSSHRTTIVQGFGPLTKKLCLLLQIVTVAGRPGLFSKAFFRSKDAIYVTFWRQKPISQGRKICFFAWWPFSAIFVCKGRRCNPILAGQICVKVFGESRLWTIFCIPASKGSSIKLTEVSYWLLFVATHFYVYCYR